MPWWTRHLWTVYQKVEILLCWLSRLSIQLLAHSFLIFLFFLQKFSLWLWKQKVWGLPLPAKSCEMLWISCLPDVFATCAIRSSCFNCSFPLFLFRLKKRKILEIATITTSVGSTARVTGRTQTPMTRSVFFFVVVVHPKPCCLFLCHLWLYINKSV